VVAKNMDYYSYLTATRIDDMKNMLDLDRMDMNTPLYIVLFPQYIAIYRGYKKWTA
jgi:hypothetical protein